MPEDRPWLPPSQRKAKPPPCGWRTVSVAHAGQQWTTCWEVKDGELHVFGAWGSEVVPLRNREPATLAGALLLKFVKARRTR